MPIVAKGRIIIYRLYDAASEIDLSAIERLDREGARRLRILKYPYMKALQFKNPPVSMELQPFTKRVFGRDVRVSVVARAYDFGVLSIAFEIPIPEGTTFGDLEAAAKELDIDTSIDALARQYAEQVIAGLGPAVVEPAIKEDFVEDYAVFYIERLGEAVDAQGFLASYDPSRLLLYETADLSRYTREETLKNSFSYYPDDLVIVHIDNAFIMEPSGSRDLPDILEFANAQFLELRYYDSVIDRELERIYGEISRRGAVSMLKLGEYERLARKITRTIRDLTEVTEKINNTLKVTEDMYYARIYRTAMTVLRCRDWEESIREKIDIITNTYKMIHDEITVKRGHTVEVGILLLIALDIALVLLGN